jgi:hypothetical protein
MHQFVGGLPGYLFVYMSDVLTVLWFLTRPFNILFSQKLKGQWVENQMSTGRDVVSSVVDLDVG